MNLTPPLQDLQDLPEDQFPPAKLKIFAPDGTIQEEEGWVRVRQMSNKGPGELSLLRVDGSYLLLNRKVVILSVETGIVAYSPALMRFHSSFWTSREVHWLRVNPSWPGILELEDHPVDNGEDNDGIKA